MSVADKVSITTRNSVGKNILESRRDKSEYVLSLRDKKRPQWNKDSRPSCSGLFDAKLQKTAIFRHTNSIQESRVMKATQNSLAKRAPRRQRKKAHEKNFLARNIERVTGRTLYEERLIEKRKGIASRSVTRYLGATKKQDYQGTAHSKANSRIGSCQRQKQASVPDCKSIETQICDTLDSAVDVEAPAVNSYAARVFIELDCTKSQRINVEQTIQGLRLLGLPATHNQIADYVYLIHEGERDTIDLEEWEILVSTLDAASDRGNFTTNEKSAGILTANSTNSASIDAALAENEPHKVVPQQSLRKSISVGTCSTSLKQNKRKHHRSKGSVQENHVLDDASYVGKLRQQVDEIVEQAHRAAIIRWNPSYVSNNQPESQIEPSQVMQRAVSVVSGLKSKLFPLLQQADETLKELRARHPSKLSLSVGVSDLEKIASNSDIFASHILDDVLEDTVHLLQINEQQTRIQNLRVCQTEMLNKLLCRIDTLMCEGEAANESNNVQMMMAEDKKSESITNATLGNSDTCIFQTPISTNIITDNFFSHIEKYRDKFLQHRRIVESSLEDTGMSQASVVEILEDLLLHDVLSDCATDLEQNMSSLADTIANKLL